MKTITIAGLGWLGLPLADLFIHKGYSVAGTTTSAEKRELIATTSLSVTVFDIYKSKPNELPQDYFEDSVLILNIPPGRQNFNPLAYSQKIRALIDHAMSHGLKQLVFISTTSVFGQTSGLITNKTPVDPLTESAKAHVAIEKHLLQQYKERACIVRPSGLVGPNPRSLDSSASSSTNSYRHPIFSLSKKAQLDSGENPVNLIHQADLLTVIAVIVDNIVCGNAYNVSALSHPSRREYYTWCAKKLGLAQPKFALSDAMIKESAKPALLHKVIKGSDTLHDLGISLAYPSPFDMLPK